MEYKFLGKINCPDDLKKLNFDELNILCNEIRDKIVSTVSVNGGHLASNLGSVELTLALHRSFNSPKDSIIFDVGHQSYTHKLITGRFEKFDTLRKRGGISGFLRPDESEHDAFVTGHSSNSISAACGIAAANALQRNGNYAVAVIGDGALTGGMAFEGLNNASNFSENLIIVINDNKMSISKNVGALARSLNKVRTNPSYYRIKSVVEKTIRKLPLIGEPLRNSIYNSKVMLKNVIYHSNIFEGLGFDYLGPVDGHNIDKMSKVFEIAKSTKRPTVVHVLTIKGIGYKYAVAKPNSYHGVAPFDVEVGLEDSSKSSFSAEFGKVLCKLADKDGKICAITAAMCEGTGLSKFAAKYPDRFFDVGIAEQHAVTFAAGLASKGYKPFFAVYSSFIQRGIDQVLHDAAIASLPITLCIDRAGLVGNDGETHQGVFDISLLSAIPNVKIFCPWNYAELESIITRAAKRDSEIWVIRYPRGSEILSGEEFTASEKDYDLISNSSDAAVISYGITFGMCYSSKFRSRFDYVKLNCINSIDETLINELLRYKKILFFEETVKRGSISELLSLKLLERGFKGKFVDYTVKDEFVKQGNQNEQREDFCLGAESINGVLAEVCDG